MQVLKRKTNLSHSEKIGMPVTRAVKQKTGEEGFQKKGQVLSKGNAITSSSSPFAKRMGIPAGLSFDLTVDSTTTCIVESPCQNIGKTEQNVEHEASKGSSIAAQPPAAQHAQQEPVLVPRLRPIISRSSSANMQSLDSPRSRPRQLSGPPGVLPLPPPQALDFPRRTRSQDAREALLAKDDLPVAQPTQIVPTPAQSGSGELERQASELNIQEGYQQAAASGLPAAAEEPAAASAGCREQPTHTAAQSKPARRSCLRQKHKTGPDGTPDPEQLILRSSGRNAAASPTRAEAGESPRNQPTSPRRSTRQRVRFSRGPLEDRYETPDGHPDHEGRLAQQKRALGASYPMDLTPSSIRMLEVELGESYRPSIDRLKRRVGLLPRVARPRRHVTPQKQKQPQPPAPAPVAAVKLRPLRVLRPRQAAAFDSDDSDEDSLLNGLDSPTSSSSTLSDDKGGLSSPLRRSTRSTASTLGSPLSADSPKADWTANSGGVRHGAARSAAAGRRKGNAPVRARPQSPRGAPFRKDYYGKITLMSSEISQRAQPGSPRSPQSSQRSAQAQGTPSGCTQPPGSPRQSGSGDPPSLPAHHSPQKRRAPCSAESDCGASEDQPRSTRRHRPQWTKLGISMFLPALAAVDANLQQHQLQQPSLHPFLLRSGSLKALSSDGASASSSFGSESQQQPASRVRGLPPLAACMQSPAQQPAVRLFCSPPYGPTATDAETVGGPRMGSLGGPWPARLRSSMEAPPLAVSGAAGGKERRALGSLYDPLLPSARMLRSNSR